MEFDRIVEENQKAVFSYLKKIVRDYQLAEDLCQETFLRALKLLRRGGTLPHPRPWLLRVARNIAFDAARRRDSLLVDSEQIEDLAAAPPDPGPGDLSLGTGVGVSRDLNPLLREGLRMLPATDREVISRRYREGMEYWEIALRNGVSAQSAKMRLFRGKRKLGRFIRSRMCRPQPFVDSQAG